MVIGSDMVRQDLCKDLRSLRLWKIVEHKGDVWDVAEQKRMFASGKSGPQSWVARIATVKHRDQCLREGVRYAAGPVFGKPEPIPIRDHMTNW